MSDAFLANVIQYLESHGVHAALMSPEQREEDPLANAEYRMGRMGEGHAVKYKELVAERERRKFALRYAQAMMAVERPGAPVQSAGTRLNETLLELRRIPSK